MPIPDTERVVYKRNPLAEVVCHLRFPPILSIDAEPPARFQEAIRTHYPIYASAPLANPQLPAEMPAAVRSLVEGLSPIRNAGSRYEFASEDRVWQVALTRDSLALKASKYDRWENFRKRLTPLIEDLVKVYRPSFYAQVALQYHDVILRSSLGIGEVDWSELINPYIAGELAAPEIAGGIDTMRRELHMKYGPNQYLQLRVWTAPHGETREQCFVINSSFHTHEKVEHEGNVFNSLDGFNRMGGNFFRWCVRDRLHNAMQPEPMAQ